MPFTETEKTRIRVLLGYSARFLQNQTTLELAMSAIEQTRPDEVLQVRDFLVQLASLDALITDTLSLMGTLAVSSIKLQGDQGIGHLKAEGRRLVEAISVIFQTPIKKNYYGGSQLGAYV